MEIRRAERGDSRDVAELWMHAFPGERTLAERLHGLDTGGVFGGIESTIVAHEGRQLVGALRAYRMTQYMGGTALPMMGLASVAVAPSARRRGVASRLCRHVLQVARERGDVVSALYPFRPAFYQAFGWALAGELHTYRFAPESLRTSDEPTPVRLASSSDEAAIADCYDRVARSANGLIARDARAWRQHLDAPESHVLLIDEARPSGYLIVHYGRARSAERRPLHVRELIAADQPAYDTLVRWISRQRDLWRRIRYDAAPDEHFALRLSEPRPPGYRPTRRLWTTAAAVIRGPMFRVVDVPAAIERRMVWGPAPPHSFTLEVQDTTLPANCGPFTIEFDGARAKIAPGRESSVVVRTDIPTFSQLYAGEIDVTAAVRLGLAATEGDVTMVDAMLRPSSSFRLLDTF